MKNLRIVGKLSIAFGIAMAALVCLGAFAIMKLGVLDDRITYMAVDQQDKQAAIATINGDMVDYRNQLAIDMLVTAPEDIRKTNEGMDAAVSDIGDKLRYLESALKAPSSRAALAVFEAEWKSFLPQAQKTRALADANKNEEAMVAFRADTLKFEAARKELKELTAAQSQNRLVKLDDAHATYETAKLLTISAIVAVLALLGFLLFLMVRSIATPIAAVTASLDQLAHGKMDVVATVNDRRDEVGALATAMAGLRDQLVAAERSKTEQTALIVDSIGRGLSSLADGNLTARIDADLTGPFGKLKTDFNNAAGSLQATLTQVSEAASGINSGAGEIRQASDDLSQRTEQQAASLEETAAAMDEITATVRSTAERAAQANTAVDGIRNAAEHSGDVVREAVQAMGGIERTSNEISEIIAVIDGIAFQTNLLALNAGVEAARAGDAGKGFAVVASEVRALAQRSAEAAKDVKARITASSEQVEAGVRLVGDTGEALSAIIKRIGEVSGLVSEITAAAQQQASGLQQVNTAVTEMDGVTQQNAAMVEEATAAARSLAGEADGLNQQIARFRLGDGQAERASPVHQLQQRAPVAGRRIAKVSPRVVGNAALASVDDDDWSEF